MKLEKEERILRIIRKHPFYMILETIGILFLAFIPELLQRLWYWIVFQLGDSGMVMQTISISANLQGFLFSLWLLALWLTLVSLFTDYFLDKWVITNQRIIHIEQIGFFSREVSSVKYPKIQDVTVDVHGVISTILDFGTIKVQTAGAIHEFTLDLAPNPLDHKEFIIDLKSRYSEKYPSDDGV